MKISDLSKERVTAVIDMGDGDVVNVVYNPRAYTIEIEEKMRELGVGGGDKNEESFRPGALAVMLEPMLVEWDIYMSEVGDFPPTLANIKKLPIAFLGKVIARPFGPTAAAVVVIRETESRDVQAILRVGPEVLV